MHIQSLKVNVLVINVDVKGMKRKETVEKLCNGDAERNAWTGEHSQKNTWG